jgi:hypothetical protein
MPLASQSSKFVKDAHHARLPAISRELYRCVIRAPRAGSKLRPMDSILGAGWYLLDVKAHYETDTELVEGGQLLAIHLPGVRGKRKQIRRQGSKEDDEVLPIQAAE